MFCSSCGAGLDGTARFCAGCGRPAETATARPPVLPATAGPRSPEAGGRWRRRAVLGGGLLVVGGVAALAVHMTLASSGLFPTGSGTAQVTWSVIDGNSSTTSVSGTVQGLDLQATVVPAQCCGNELGTISGTLGGTSFNATASESGEEDYLSGTYNSQPVSGTAIFSDDRNAVTVQGTIEGQPVTGTMRRIGDSERFAFSGTVGNLRVSGHAGHSSDGFTSTQEVG